MSERGERGDEPYREYLDSPQWAELRSRVLFRDRHVCQECFKRQATEVHHLSYNGHNRYGSARAYELISLCHWCHCDIEKRPYRKPKPDMVGACLVREWPDETKKGPGHSDGINPSPLLVPNFSPEKENPHSPKLAPFGANCQ